jgi:hypothetical protein
MDAFLDIMRQRGLAGRHRCDRLLSLAQRPGCLKGLLQTDSQ